MYTIDINSKTSFRFLSFVLVLRVGTTMHRTFARENLICDVACLSCIDPSWRWRGYACWKARSCYLGSCDLVNSQWGKDLDYAVCVKDLQAGYFTVVFFFLTYGQVQDTQLSHKVTGDCITERNQLPHVLPGSRQQITQLLVKVSRRLFL